MASFLTSAWDTILNALHDVEIVKNGEPADVSLLTRVPASGTFEEFTSIDEGWTKSRVNQGFGVFTEEFQIAERLLTAEDARKVHAVRHNDVIFMITDEKIPPTGFDRFWRLRIKPVEKAGL